MEEEILRNYLKLFIFKIINNKTLDEIQINNTSIKNFNLF